MEVSFPGTGTTVHAPGETVRRPQEFRQRLNRPTVNGAGGSRWVRLRVVAADTAPLIGKAGGHVSVGPGTGVRAGSAAAGVEALA
jgi:hypothetical protein